eukprot:CAMPEP_0206243456 /NCGR_PEP_ID=MMETSP0047_2-20121206/17615_1 /ASSEMBLY_ACC=CAM_ASM_000192 /TAXON_ID=195065 /ORGANISM="Chroomonas mesostigmatica_cf, Strain CCMP1168" /LENGTH=249 /DNA_ID=CAMNT_0053668573 /DNA_START=147 /DNA_END=893 /DNA_ORIENTATION=+
MALRLMLAVCLPVVAALIFENWWSAKLVTVEASITFMVCLVGVLLFVTYHRCMNERTQRRLWGTQQVLKVEKEAMGQILYDMLPPSYAAEMLHQRTAVSNGRRMSMGPNGRRLGQGAEGSSNGRRTSVQPAAAASLARRQTAVVLFSDLVGFTGLNQMMTPYEVAMVMHDLWCAFDALVQKYGMHKMDTVGDAFIVIGLVGDSKSTLKNQAQRMVDLAREMVVLLEDLSFAIFGGVKYQQQLRQRTANG